MNSMNLNMLHSLKPFHCPNCNSSYSSRDAARYNVTRFPRILSCYHSMCENCLHSVAKNGTFTCPTCQETIGLSDDPDGLSQLHPDVHALGILSVNMKNSLPSIKTRFVSSTGSKKNKGQESLKKLVSALACGHCHKNDALWQCDECQLNFCSICFGDVHGDMKSKKKHEAKKIFAELYNSMVQEGCSEHENKAVEFYCEIDDQLTCSYCMLMGDHVGHEVKTLLDKNKSCADALRKVLDDVTKMQRQLKYTDHLLCNTIPKEKIDTSHLIKEIHDHFHKLHAMLQIRESELINELTEISEGNIRPLEEMRLKVTSLERDLAAGKKDAESVINNPCLAISAPALLKKLEDSKNLPCHLVPLSDCGQDSKYVNIDLELSSELEDQLKQFGQLKCNMKPKFSLMAESELPETFSPSEIPDTFDVKTLDSESCSTSVDNFSEDSLSIDSDFSSVRATLKCREFTKMQPEKVSVTHIKSPSSFFVQKYSDARRLLNMSAAIDKYCKYNDGKKLRSDEIVPGDLYLVKYSADNRWYRGRIRQILDPDELYEEKVIGKRIPMISDGGRIVVIDKEIKADVFYIDFGNSETVSLHNIKNILPRFLNAPSLAKECSLVDIQPVYGPDWSEECTKMFAKFVGNKPLIMQVYEERNNVFFVDLCQTADNDISRDTPVSVRDALVFLELGVFPAGVKTTDATSKRNKYRAKYMPPESLRVNANIWAIVSHVEDPYSFYVQQMSTASYLSTLIFELNETYTKDENSILHSIYVPYIGMVCAAQFSVDKQWYRAEVISLPGGARVEVRYVDFGNTEVIHHKYLRKLFDKFLKLNVQAIPCRLAHVSYNQDKCWSTAAKEWLTNEVSRKQLTVKSLGMIPGTKKSEVVLYYSDDVFDICLNSLMVEKGFATATGPFGSADVKVKKEIPLSKESVDGKKVAVVTKSICDEIQPPSSAKNEPNHFLSPPKTSAQTTKMNSPVKNAPPKKYPSLAVPTITTDSEVVEVHVTHTESPGCFYIRMAGEIEKKFNLLMEEMQKAYKDLDGEIIDCLVGKAYATYSQNQKKWLRGCILSKLSDDTFQVRFVDNGKTEEIHKKDIRKLLDKFAKEDSFVVKCHLDGIIPAGGSSQWPRTACDAFQRIVEQYEILLLSYKRSPDADSLPADLFIENLIRGGALEPTKLEYISISQEIINNGLGLPLRKKSGAPSGLEVQQVSDSKTGSWATRVEESEKENEVVINSETTMDTSQASPPPVESSCISTPIENTSINLPVENSCIPPPVENVCIPPPIENVCIPPPIENAHISPPVENAYIRPSVENAFPPASVIKSPKPAAPKFQWKPAIPPLESSFRAFVTNIGEDGSIHLYALNEGSSQVDIIKKALQFKFSRGTYEPLTEPPPVGEACIAKFSVDDMWYRAEVISAYSDKIKVNFVDYGNNEIIALKDIRPEIIMQTFPRLCIECSLFGLEGKIKWDNDMTTFLHNQLVETEVQVEVKGPSENGRLPCQIKMLSGIDVADLLLSMGFDSVDSEDFKELSVSQTDLSSIQAFRTPREWREGDVFPVCVAEVPSPNIVYLQQLKIDNPKDDYEREHNQQHELFLQLIADLRQKADNFPKLKEPLPGMPCCAKYSYDKDWYRCEVTDLTQDGVVVLYVDYGNTETVAPDDLRELESSFIDFPVQVYFCELHGMKPVGPTWDSSVHEKIIKKLMVADQDFFARVVVPGKISQVDILTKIDGQYKLVYEDLVEENLIILDK